MTTNQGTMELIENNTALELIEKINTKTAKIGVIGLGYVGLPLAVEKAKVGYQVIGFDIQQKKVEMVNSGINYIGDVIDGDLKKVVESGKLKASSDYDEIRELDIVTICVPTPIDKNKQPDLTYVKNSTKEIAKRLHTGMLIVLESTTYPGTTEEVLKPILEDTGLKCGQDFFLAYSPERVDPGNKRYNTKNTPKVVGGVTKFCTKVAAALYRNVLEGEVFEVSSPKVAEMEKIYENVFRHVNIALANEMALLCRRMGIDVWEVIEAAKTKPYGFMPFYPGPGIGGHCIPVDPYYLLWKAREYDFHTRFIELAGEINEYMPKYTVERAAEILNEASRPLKNAKILILGVAYKKDIDDMRESPVLKIIEELEKVGADVKYNDPYIPEFTHKGKHYRSIKITEELLKDADLVIIATDHSTYDPNFILEHSKLILDTRNAMKNLSHPKIHKL
ncbi:nucleotide sugar dehydrogenase [Thermosediminibacter oceani]|uniref:Nucleotide sugar dehydrogenase n=1 Tax=Thermosediminibacter oceani (strain ATCC BAA-1034 / DSM 16646 / JW/IW-1228P) TaxID=555079 RepID=D9RYA7_THEOJ|nr:nucleotide sugar dehydrogenase [Thermosediminibacter oceani]ADL08331.1 nucleotide sugar dehydrogenase [Thermosediminibacter oceani DSM 16646]